MTNLAPRMTRHNIQIPDPLWQAAVEAARAQSEAEGRTVTTSEWIRQAIESRLRGRTR